VPPWLAETLHRLQVAPVLADRKGGAVPATRDLTLRKTREIGLPHPLVDVSSLQFFPEQDKPLPRTGGGDLTEGFAT